MKDYIKNAYETIDNAMFSFNDDTFEHADERKRLTEYIDRWQRGIEAHRAIQYGVVKEN